MTASLESVLLAAVRARSGGAVERWMDTAVRAHSVDALCATYTAAPKHVGRAALAVDDIRRRELTDLAPGLGFDRWTLDDAARAALLLGAAARLPRDAFAAAAAECFERGDAREQQSWLRAISLLPDCERFLAIAIDACRTNIIPLFEAIACENPYPAQYFPDRNFNQLVLKALFNGIAISRIVGLSRRLNAELARMAGDYAAERRAAGRPVAADIALAMSETGTSATGGHTR